ncbi:MAG: uroporphyrinogen-III C-methyltransferase [Alphaproteobacteria bacterium]
MSALPITLTDIEPGWVWLVGAGPGDPGLMTLHALSALRSADVIVYDALVSPDILAFAKEGAELVHAGKRGGKPSAAQDDITAALVNAAKANKRVLRLKGGDPFVFGRGGEEALVLVEEGIPFRLIPGVTAGVAAPAYAGIPVTHRSANQAVTFITGHSASGDVPGGVDWEAIAKTAPVLVIYMGIRHLPKIVERLRSGGRKTDEPAAAIAQATTRDQQVVRSTLGQLAEDAAAANIKAPALVIIGDVVDLSDHLNWVDPIRQSVLTAAPVGRHPLSGDDAPATKQ